MEISFNLIPVYCIVEKRFAVAARMVDELLNSEYSKLVPYEITYDEWDISKYDLAIMFYNFSDDIINDFVNLLQIITIYIGWFQKNYHE